MSVLHQKAPEEQQQFDKALMRSFFPPEITAAGTNTSPAPAQTVPLPNETLASTMALAKDLLGSAFFRPSVQIISVPLLSRNLIGTKRTLRMRLRMSE